MIDKYKKQIPVEISSKNAKKKHKKNQITFVLNQFN
jgi:hypothetical protein